MQERKRCLEKVGDVIEAAELWGLKADTVKHYASAGKIVARKSGRHWLIDLTQPNPKQYKK